MRGITHCYLSHNGIEITRGRDGEVAGVVKLSFVAKHDLGSNGSKEAYAVQELEARVR